jgi:hypothetical protein
MTIEAYITTHIGDGKTVIKETNVLGKVSNLVCYRIFGKLIRNLTLDVCFYQFGKDMIKIDWQNAPNPSPTYYRNLPSYIASLNPGVLTTDPDHNGAYDGISNSSQLVAKRRSYCYTLITGIDYMLKYGTSSCYELWC